jgi:hypothetical protein
MTKAKRVVTLIGMRIVISYIQVRSFVALFIWLVMYNQWYEGQLRPVV